MVLWLTKSTLLAGGSLVLAHLLPPVLQVLPPVLLPEKAAQSPFMVSAAVKVTLVPPVSVVCYKEIG